MECEKKEYQLQAVCFAATTSVFIVCFERAVVRSFMEQWRVLMFLALNLLLLAILFTSTRQASSYTEGFQNDNGGVEDLKAAAESKKRSRKLQCKSPLLYADNDEGVEFLKLVNSARSKREADDDVKIQENVDDDEIVMQEDIHQPGACRTSVGVIRHVLDTDTSPLTKCPCFIDDGEAEVNEEGGEQLSKEELNARVEAFIAMFRQHLISDAKGNGCSRKG